MSKSLRKPNLKTRVAINLLMALGYYSLAELSRNLASTPNAVTPVWPPDGWAVGLTLIYGHIGLPGVWLGSFLANIGAFGESQSFLAFLASFLSILGLALGTTIGTWLSSSILNRLTQYQYPFSQVIHTLRFLACAAIGPLSNATFGVTMLALNQQISWSNYGFVWVTWWISNVAGILILTPVLLSGQRWWQQYWHQHRHQRQTPAKASSSSRASFTQTPALRWLEGAIVISLLTWVAKLCFWGQQPLAYTLVPLLVWLAFRFGQLGATLGVLWTAAIAVLGTVQGLGPFAQNDLYQALVGLQCFIGVIGFTVLILIAVLEERRSTAICLGETIDELQKTNQELAGYTAELDRAAKLKDEFLSTVSHELRTPLVGILGMTELLQQNNQEPLYLSQLDAIQTIDRSGQHLLSLIDEILNFTHIKSGRLSLFKERVDVRFLCQTVLDIIAPVAVQKNIELTGNIAPDIRDIELDAKRIQQVLINLLNNAVKYTSEGGQVVLEVKQVNKKETNQEVNSGQLQFLITDTGMGIPDHELEHIFDRFFQVDRQHNRKSEGLGLGLAIAKQLVELHQGQIKVSSVLGQGSCFTVELPYAGSQEFIANYGSQSETTDSPYILVAEDDRVSQTILQRTLERHHYRVVITPNGQEAIHYADQETPALILMDIQMPVMDGLEAISTLRQDSRFQAVPIVVLTTFSQPEDRKRCLQVGATEYLTKPINIDKLLTIIKLHYPQPEAKIN